MFLDENTIKVLKNFASINPSILFKKGNTLSTISPQKTVIASATLDKEIPQEFAIFDLSRFLGVISLFPKIEALDFQDKFLTIKSDRQSIKYVFADKEMIVTPPEKALKLGDPDVEFSITKDQLNQVNKALGVLQMEEIAVVGDEKEVAVEVLDTKNSTADSFRLRVADSIGKNFRAVFKSGNLNLLEDDYKVLVFKKGLGQFVGKTVSYFVALESNSSTI